MTNVPYLMPLTNTQENLHASRLQRMEAASHIDTRSVDLRAARLCIEQLYEHEQALASPTLTMAGYDNGAATNNDEIRTSLGKGQVLLCSEHATTHWRLDSTAQERRRKTAETGTAALGAAIAESINGTHITMLGRQTRDANNDAGHPLRDHITELLGHHNFTTFVTLHGMLGRYVDTLDDTQCFDMIIGTGDKPTPATTQLAQKLVEQARAYGLRAGINTALRDIQNINGRFFQRTNDKQQPLTQVFAGAHPTLRQYIEDYAGQSHHTMAAIQIELATSLRLMTPEVSRTQNAGVIGPFIGQQIISKALAA